MNTGTINNLDKKYIDMLNDIEAQEIKLKKSNEKDFEKHIIHMDLFLCVEGKIKFEYLERGFLY
jgi:hypothetical protein